MTTDAALIVAREAFGGYAPGPPAISALSFRIEAGSLVSVIGPNGAGKSTLFRALLGELPQTGGELEVRAEIAYVPQSERPRLDFPIDALGVVEMGTHPSLPWYRRVGAEQRRAATHALARVGLAAKARTRFGELSSGQRQRVLVARALARQAPVICLDEPLSGVDQPSAERLLAIMAELRDEGRALLVSTHDIGQAADSDLVLCLNGSQIAFGRPESVLSDEVLQRTYGGELVVLPGGRRAILTDHHDHGHEHGHSHAGPRTGERK